MRRAENVSGRISPALRSIAVYAVAAAMAAYPLAADAKSKTGLLRLQSQAAASAAAQSKSPLLIVVSIKKQRLRVYDMNGEIASSKISSGKPGHDTPTGVFSILEKNVYHVSNIYSGASMPYQERITWSGIALHAGDLPGYRASHGCIRLPYSFARKLFGLTKIGNRVVVSYDDPDPIAFDSPKLFKPLPLDDATAMQGGLAKPQLIAVNDRPDDHSAAGAGVRLIGISPALLRAVADMPKDLQRRPTTRAEADQIMQEKLDRARAAVKTAEAALTSADEKAQQTAKDFTDVNQKFETARRSIEPLRAAVKSAEAQQTTAMKAFEAYMADAADNSKSASAGENADMDRESDLEDALLDATIEADKARADAAANELSFAGVQGAYSSSQSARDGAADALRDAQSDLTSAKAALTDVNKEMRLRSKPVAVLISLRAQRIYVRQGFEPLLEAPIEVAPLKHKVGTHVFTAMNYGTDPNTFDWRLVSAQTPSPGQAFEEGKKKRRRTALAQGRELDVQMANEALNAFTIPDDIRQTISELARPGSSLIVSDRELPLHENGSGTEFVVLTR
ncbi:MULTISPECIES: L,D-transpeptidase family protein [unclassified Hyphomicrobium]|uniref:L,D-transpeptidase family protein n=1 Tax=unclassified Hyphomicrobium TaxID=2619925 RepID=UPI000213DFAA|nr:MULTISPECIES: L,D-transpeptidase family protein [unclassified Hyphomicrobium]CCB66398.1 ErfK/YbiS/YcfS/YnhG family protein [Hyphomicrobium sp. MC1]